MNNAPDIPRERFTAMTRLDHNRAMAQLAQKAGVHGRATSRNMTIWGNHSPTHVPRHLQREGRRASRAGDAVDDRTWLENEFIPTRGASAARRSSRRAARRQRRVGGQRGDRPRARLGARHAGRRLGLDGGALATAPTASRRGSSPASPCTCADGEWEIVEGLDIDDFSRARIDATVNELTRGARHASKRARPDLASSGSRVPALVPLRDLALCLRASGITRYR